MIVSFFYEGVINRDLWFWNLENLFFIKFNKILVGGKIWFELT